MPARIVRARAPATSPRFPRAPPWPGHRRPVQRNYTLTPRRNPEACGGGSDVLLITGPSCILDWIDDVAADLSSPGHAAEKINRLSLDRQELRNRLAPFCDDYRPAPLCHLVNQPQTVGCEVGRPDVPVVAHAFSHWSP